MGTDASSDATSSDATSGAEPAGDSTALAANGSDSPLPYLAGVGALTVIAGGALVLRRRRPN